MNRWRPCRGLGGGDHVDRALPRRHVLAGGAVGCRGGLCADRRRIGGPRKSSQIFFLPARLPTMSTAASHVDGVIFNDSRRQRSLSRAENHTRRPASMGMASSTTAPGIKRGPMQSHSTASAATEFNSGTTTSTASRRTSTRASRLSCACVGKVPTMPSRRCIRRPRHSLCAAPSNDARDLWCASGSHEGLQRVRQALLGNMLFKRRRTSSFDPTFVFKIDFHPKRSPCTSSFKRGAPTLLFAPKLLEPNGEFRWRNALRAQVHALDAKRARAQKAARQGPPEGALPCRQQFGLEEECCGA